MTTSETGQLVGGPHDGTHFPTNDRFWLAQPGLLPEPAQRVYATPEGNLSFWFTASVKAEPAFGVRPPLSRYDLCPHDAGWVYRYAGEED